MCVLCACYFPSTVQPVYGFLSGVWQLNMKWEAPQIYLMLSAALETSLRLMGRIYPRNFFYIQNLLTKQVRALLSDFQRADITLLGQCVCIILSLKQNLISEGLFALKCACACIYDAPTRTALCQNTIHAYLDFNLRSKRHFIQNTADRPFDKFCWV